MGTMIDNILIRDLKLSGIDGNYTGDALIVKDMLDKYLDAESSIDEDYLIIGMDDNKIRILIHKEDKIIYYDLTEIWFPLNEKLNSGVININNVVLCYINNKLNLDMDSAYCVVDIERRIPEKCLGSYDLLNMIGIKYNIDL